jgi:hypothetical protein
MTNNKKNDYEDRSYSSISNNSNDYDRETIQSINTNINDIEINRNTRAIFYPITPPADSSHYIGFIDRSSNNSEKRNTIQDILDNQKNNNIPLLEPNNISIPMLNIPNNSINKYLSIYTFIIEFINNIILLLLNFYINKNINYDNLITIEKTISNNLIIYQINNQIEFYNFLKYIFLCTCYILNKLLILYIVSDNIFYVNNEFFISMISIILDKKNKRYILYFLLINIISSLLIIYILTLYYGINTIEKIYKPNILNNIDIDYYNISVGSLIYYILIIKLIFYNNVYDKRILLSILYGLNYFIFKFNGLNNIIIIIYLEYYNNNYNCYYNCYLYILIIIITFIIAMFINKYLYSKYIKII